MFPALVLYFKPKIHKFMTNDPVVEVRFDPETSEMHEEEKRLDDPNPRVKSYSPGGGVFDIEYVEKFDAEHNALYLRPTWRLTANQQRVKIHIRLKDRESTFHIGRQVLRTVKIVYADDFTEEEITAT